MTAEFNKKREVNSDGIPRILICDPVHEEALAILENKGWVIDRRFGISREELRQIARQYDGVMVRSRTEIDKEVIEGAEGLVIVRVGTGLDNIDLEAAAIHKVTVLNTPDATTQSVAEHTLGLTLAVAYNISKRQLSGKTLGIVGLGRIGSRFAQMAKAIDTKLIACDISDVSERAEKLGIEIVNFRELLRISDVVSLHAPLNASTRDMIGAREFEMMKDGAALTNTSRGGLVVERALLDALNSGKLSGAGLDVYRHDPATEQEMRLHDKIILTPHIGASTVEAQRRAGLEAAERLIQVLENNE